MDRLSDGESRSFEASELPCGAVLAGGRSLRMGQPKSVIRLWDGRTMLEHILDTMLEVCPRVMVVGMDESLHTQAGERITYLSDRSPGRGPLSGLDALLASDVDEGYLVAACDQPLLSATLLRRLAAGDPNRPHFFRTEQHRIFVPLPLYLPTAVHSEVEIILKSAERSLRVLADKTSPVWIEISPEEETRLTNVNTPAELVELHRQMQDTGTC